MTPSQFITLSAKVITTDRKPRYLKGSKMKLVGNPREKLTAFDGYTFINLWAIRNNSEDCVDGRNKLNNQKQTIWPIQLFQNRYVNR